MWAEGKQGIIGLVADDNVGTYLCLYGPEGRNIGAYAGNPVPALAICMGKDGKVVLQLPTGARGVKHIQLERILDLLQAAPGVTAEPFATQPPQ